MQKQKLKSNFLSLMLIPTLLFSILVFTGVECSAELTPTSQTTLTQEQTALNQKTVNAPSIPEKNAYALTHMEKKGFKYTLFKFFMTMLGVIVSALAIFLGLKFYKKISLKKSLKQDNVDYDKLLESPNDFKDAINLFLDKTDK